MHRRSAGTRIKEKRRRQTSNRDFVGEEEMDTAVERSEAEVVEMTAGTCTGDGPLPEIEEPRAVAPRDARELSRQFFQRLSELEEGTHEYQYARNTLIEMNISLVRFAAGRFRGRGDDMEDLVQTGMIGLIKAIDRFELSREVEFTSFALPYIVGEIKRFFRDTTWAVHVPRRLQELRVELAKAREELASRLDREPTVPELATLMNLPEQEVIEGQIASNGYNSSSLDAALTGDGPESGEAVLADFIGMEEDGLRLVEDFQSLAPLMAELGERDRQIIHMRFVEEATQAEIGERLGCSQMHVSRLIKRIIARLREGMLGELGYA
jgi:RNA polymerase sigma-B factor